MGFAGSMMVDCIWVGCNLGNKQWEERTCDSLNASKCDEREKKEWGTEKEENSSH